MLSRGSLAGHLETIGSHNMPRATCHCCTVYGRMGTHQLCKAGRRTHGD